jgi:hypothetical protein
MAADRSNHLSRAGHVQGNRRLNVFARLDLSYGEMNVAFASNRLCWIESNLSVWNGCSAASSAMVCPIVDLGRNRRVTAAWFGEGYAARERTQANTIREHGQRETSVSSLDRFWIELFGFESPGNRKARTIGGSGRSPGDRLHR